MKTGQAALSLPGGGLDRRLRSYDNLRSNLGVEVSPRDFPDRLAIHVINLFGVVPSREIAEAVELVEAHILGNRAVCLEGDLAGSDQIAL